MDIRTNTNLNAVLRIADGNVGTRSGRGGGGQSYHRKDTSYKMRSYAALSLLFLHLGQQGDTRSLAVEIIHSEHVANLLVLFSLYEFSCPCDS